MRSGDNNFRGETTMKVMIPQRPTELKGTWMPFVPDEQVPWDLRRVVHLHRRAGFAATWEELQRDLKQGPVASVDRLLIGKVNADVPPDFAATADLLADATISAGVIGRLRAAWFYRMLFGPDPLCERLTLLWHDHFATTNVKVQDVALMRRQNDTFRRHARGKYAELLNASVRQPALLVFLDAPANRKAHPNENLARELMELFTLGVGHFAEVDVKEAARCLTGWDVDEGQFVERLERHDTGEKTLFGAKGRWTGTDLVTQLLNHPATAHRLAFKLCREFFGESGPSVASVNELAAGLREHDLDIGWAIRTILKSKLFYADANLGCRVLSPVEFVVGSVRALALFDPPPSTLALADWSGRMGQELLDPPNVGGWPGGRAWINTRSLIARANYVAALLEGSGIGRPMAYDPVMLPVKHGFGSDKMGILTFHHQLLFGTDPSDDLKRLTAGLDNRKAVALLLASPQNQVG